MKNTDLELKTLSSLELLTRTQNLVTEERQVTVLLISHLEEIQTRRLHAEKGYSSMWEFCTQFLGLSEGAAQRRIAAMRFTQAAPEAKAALESGALSLSNAAKLHTFRQAQKKQGIPQTDAVELLKKVEGLSQRKCEEKLFEISPSILSKMMDRDRVVSANGDRELKIVISAEVFEKLQQIKGLLAHSKPNASFSELIEHMAIETLTRLQKKKGIVPKDVIETEGKTEAKPNGELKNANADDKTEPNTKTNTPLAVKALPAGKRVYLPVKLRRHVFANAGGQCEIIHEGRRCTSRYALELDHITPLAHGGSNELSNLRATCKAHNLQAAKAMGLS